MRMKNKHYAIPVLMYHHVNTEGSFINVSPRRFESHIKYLQESGYTSLNASDLLGIFHGTRNPPDKPVVITFDDGWLDNWLFAFPILKKCGMKAIIFVVTSLIHEKGKRMRSDEGTVKGLPTHKECQKMVDSGSAQDVMLSWEEIREMENTGLIDIQSHTHTHQRWDKVYPDHKERMKTINEELKISKEIIEEKLKKKCDALCWPWGKYNDEYVEAAKSSGYKLLFTTEKGANTPATGTWKIKRIVIGNIGNITLRKKLAVFSRDWLSKAYLKCFK
jgi:peptidoglycan/xylan/chitin deacetylase (PgdA/CDA1 family)